ncbi:ferritin-like domain-containing protein [Streptomyces sp. NPDC058001]|uniref:ferritin-like domain-containing protein n=1 Tax=Streptomyces sp. NPDC058001 TaxID=3346300 RepID=UPI0036EBC5A0
MTRTATKTPGTSTDGDKAKKAELKAVQAALAAEHAAVYGYGVVGGRIREGRSDDARSAYDAHRARRDELSRAVRDLGGRPEPSAAAYALPFPVPDAAAAARLAADLEERIAGVYADLVRASGGERRRAAADALRDAAVRAVRWRGGSVAFPGLAERAGTPDPEATTTPQT